MRPNVSFCRRFFPWFIATLLCLFLQTNAFADATSASISITLSDSSGALITDASMMIRNTETNQIQQAKSGRDGSARFPYLKAGRYTVIVSKAGFADLKVDNIVLNVGDQKVLELQLKIGSSDQAVTVDGSGLTINTTDASVSTVVDRTFVANMPLNGRSFQDLISMTPGVNTASPQGTQGSGSIGSSGDFSVNGQRTQANYYTVDGVSANVGAGNGYGASSAGVSGGLAAGTAFGTTQSLASVDELQEFRVTSSTYSAEYGFGPGGQFGLLTRSGTDVLHGTTYDYLRNDFFDANDWFNNHYAKPRPALRQNDFGGTLGGSVWLPRVYDGRKSTFFFASYEGLRITQPQAASIQYVPDSYMRQQAASVLQPILNAFPLQNGIDFGSAATPSLAQFITSYSLPGSINSTSIRFDHTFFPQLSSFFRFSNTASSTTSRAESVLTSLKFNTRTYTLGATSALSPATANEFRLGFAHSEAANAGLIDGFEGAQPIDLRSAMGASAYEHALPEFIFIFAGIGSPALAPQAAQNLQSQWNVADSVTLTVPGHLTKLGIDYRWIRSPKTPSSPLAEAVYQTATQVSTNSATEGFVQVKQPAVPIFQQFAAFVQEEWTPRRFVTISAGLRWELSPPPSAEGGNVPYTLTGYIGDPSNLHIAPKGSPLWTTAKYNFAPRLGVAWIAHSTSGLETVLRAGGGVYFDSSNEVAAQGYSGIGYTTSSVYGYGTLPAFSLPFLPAQLAIKPSVTPPYTAASVYAFPSNMQSPYTIQWNVSTEQSLGTQQSLTVSYIGSSGRRLVGEQQLSLHALNPNFGTVIYFPNHITSSYQALQLKFQRSVARGLHALVAYTWSHSLDFGSNDTSLPLERGNSDFDVRHNFQAGMSWDIPAPRSGNFGHVLFSGWGLDGRVLARTAFPITLNGNFETDPNTGNQFYSGVNYDSSRPVYLYGNQYPGGKALNGGANNTRNPAFTAPSGQNVSGTAPRNFVRGFGLEQLNLGMRRAFPVYRRTSLQFRAEAFNLLNRPNFGYVDPLLTDATFGQSTTMLNGSLGTVAAQYQQGGSRSMQFELKLQF